MIAVPDMLQGWCKVGICSGQCGAIVCSMIYALQVGVIVVSM